MLSTPDTVTADTATLTERLGTRVLPLRVLAFVSAAAKASERPDVLGHAQQVAGVLLDIDADDESLAAALVVTALPKNEIEQDMIVEAFGAEVMSLVHGVQRAGRIESLAAVPAGSKASAPGIESLRKMLLAMADDVRVVLIKLAERVILMRAITKADDKIRKAAGLQTRDLFAPLANRLGVFQIKWELEDYAFRFLEPDLYKRIAGYLDGKRGERETYVHGVVEELRAEIRKLGVKAEIAGRPKHLWSIHRKMQAKSLPFEKLYDVRAVRVLVDNIADCYVVLGLAHDRWQPIPGEFDDYIAQPKANNYQSLHTAVIGPGGKTLEVQIRTHEMHIASEHGVAAHWRYKESTKESARNKTAAERKFESKIAWLRQVLEWNRELADRSGFSDQVKQGLFNDTVYVFTPQGKVIDLTAGSTPVDFAYHVHTDLGHRCRGAKVDGHIVPLNTRLENAQRVEILSAKQGGPSRDWLNPQLGFLMSPRAQAKVRTWFRQEYFEVDVAHGRQTMEKELARAGATATALEKVALALEHKELNECLAAIGRGEITAHQIEVAIRALVAPRVENTTSAPEVAVVESRQTAKTSSGVLVLGLNNIATMVAKCCKPMPCDAIVGFITKARGVTVHRIDCINITSLSAEQRDRLMPAEWGNTGDQPFAAELEVIAGDRQGLLRDISEALSHERINVTAVNTLSKNNVASMRFTVEIQRAEQLQRVLRSVGEVAGVESIRRR